MGRTKTSDCKAIGIFGKAEKRGLKERKKSVAEGKR